MLSDLSKFIPIIATVIITFFNLLFFVGNILWSIFFRTEDRKYNYNLQTYKILFTDNIKDYITYSSKLEQELSSILNIVKHCRDEQRREKIEISCNKLKETFGKFEREKIILLFGYSHNLYKDVLDACEKIYDDVTEIVFSLDIDKESINQESVLETFKNCRKRFFNTFFKYIDIHKPEIK